MSSNSNNEISENATSDNESRLLILDEAHKVCELFEKLHRLSTDLANSKPEHIESRPALSGYSARYTGSKQVKWIHNSNRLD